MIIRGILPWSLTLMARAAVIFWSLTVWAGPPDAFKPDPATVQRFARGYRYPQEGWIVLHLEGGPYERGVQHGRLLAPEIVGYLQSYAAERSSASLSDGWKLTRTIVNTAFLRKFDHEFLEEMKGIADGAAAAGARFEGRPLDLVDIVGINLWPELMTHPRSAQYMRRAKSNFLSIVLHGIHPVQGLSTTSEEQNRCLFSEWFWIGVHWRFQRSH